MSIKNDFGKSSQHPMYREGVPRAVVDGKPAPFGVTANLMRQGKPLIEALQRRIITPVARALDAVAPKGPATLKT